MKKLLKIAAVVLAVLVVATVIAVYVLAGRFDQKMLAADTPYPPVTVSTDPTVLARGEYLVRTAAHCTQCHGDYERAHPENNDADVPLSGGFEFAMGPIATLYAPNLTPDPETGIGNRTPEQLARTIATGVLPDGRVSIFMAYSAGDLSEQDLSAVVSYLRSAPPVRHEVPAAKVTAVGKAVFSFMPFAPDTAPLPSHVEPAEEPSVARGEYLAEHVALCVVCHTQFDQMAIKEIGPKGGGSLPGPSPGNDGMEMVAPNLTADPKTGMTGKLSEDQFLARLRGGRTYPFSLMPWENLSRMTESDIRSVYRYLRTLPPVENDVGPTVRAQGWKPPT